MLMLKLALTTPFDGGSTSFFNPAQNFPARSTDLGDVISQFSEVAIYIGGILMIFWAIWGIFDYLKAEGNKEGLAKARKKIQWAIVGFIILIMAFFVSDFVFKIVNAPLGGRQPLQEVTDPNKP